MSTASFTEYIFYFCDLAELHATAASTDMYASFSSIATTQHCDRELFKDQHCGASAANIERDEIKNFLLSAAHQAEKEKQTAHETAACF
jgi:hypothetical protein